MSLSGGDARAGRGTTDRVARVAACCAVLATFAGGPGGCSEVDNVGMLGGIDTEGTTSTGADGGGTTTQSFDTPEGHETLGDEKVGCKRADFLFVIDNSGSMQDEQQNLIGSFPGFIDTIRNQTMAKDFHIMVVDTDASGGGGTSVACTNGDCECSPVPGCCHSLCDNGGADTCNGFPCDALPGGDCDKTLGAGKVFREDGTQCLDSGEVRFMAETEPNLGDTFACVAEVGTYGDGNEQPMGAMTAAISNDMIATGECNDGFLRDDAILVVTFITDEEDADKSPGEPQAWHDTLVEVKRGDPDAIVVLGLFGDNDETPAICDAPMDDMGAEPGPRLREFVEKFGNRGVVGSVCADDYNPFFIDAVSVIDVACNEFVPPG